MSFNFYQFLRDGLGHGHLGSALFLNSKSQRFLFTLIVQIIDPLILASNSAWVTDGSALY